MPQFQACSRRVEAARAKARTVDATPKRVFAQMVVRPVLCTAGGILHGGAYMAFADTLGAIGTVMGLRRLTLDKVADTP